MDGGDYTAFEAGWELRSMAVVSVVADPVYNLVNFQPRPAS